MNPELPDGADETPIQDQYIRAARVPGGF